MELERAVHTSPPLLGHRKPFPIGDKVTFSGKDCVCQNCSHSLISTKPIKIHGPSRKLTALMLRDGCKERDDVPLDGAMGWALGKECSAAWHYGRSWRFRRRNRVVLWPLPGLQVTAGFGNSLGLFVTCAGATAPVGAVWGSREVLKLSLL